MIENKIYTVLSGATLVTSKTSTRIYPVALNQTGTYPSISYSRTGGERIYDLDGYDGLENAVFVLNVYATALDSLAVLSSAVIKTMEETTQFKVTVKSDTETYSDRLRLRRRAIEFSIWNNE